MSSTTIKAPKKLIEVALPLDAINAASAREKSIRHGHPSTLHIWWARRPLAAARAVIFAQLVNDPSWKWEMEHPGEIPPGHLKASWAASRKRLFKIIEELVLWDNTTNEAVLERARAEIRKSWLEVCELNKDHPQASELFDPENMPGLHDPFAGGGAIPLEAQRLGMNAFASDLNPVAVLINKAMIEIPPKFAGMCPVNPETRSQIDGASGTWRGATGLAQDIKYYGQWMHNEAEKRIGKLYPPIEISESMAERRPELKQYIGQKLKVIAWIWARTVKSPNPAFSNVDIPLASTFVLSSKSGKEAYVLPVVDNNGYRFTVSTGPIPTGSKEGTSMGKRKGFRCLMSDVPVDYQYIRNEGVSGRMGQKLMAIVVEGKRERIYIEPRKDDEELARSVAPEWVPNCEMPSKHRNFQPPVYGMHNIGDLFTPRQLHALNTFSNLVDEARLMIQKEAEKQLVEVQDAGESETRFAPTEYANAVAIYLGMTSSKACRFITTLSVWRADEGKLSRAFGRQALPMTWDFAETNPFSGTGGDFLGLAKGTADTVDKFVPTCDGLALQASATNQQISLNRVISTDPPYYDNISYADLSDYFYVWLRKSLRHLVPDIFATLAVPKTEELIASPNRHSNKREAEGFFLDGMTTAMHGLSKQSHPAFPVSIYYAFKQSNTSKDGDTSNTGWETFLSAVINSGFSLQGTWPMRTEGATRMNSRSNNSLASSIVLVCRKRPGDAPTTSRRSFIRELNRELPDALDEMTKGSGDEQSPVAPVDLSQAIIGPGMAVFSKYSAVLEADGSAMSVKTALQLINRFLAEDDFDADTSFCLHWFEQYGWKDGIFGEADVLARAKGTSVDGVNTAGVIASGSGQVRLLKWADYPTDWDAAKDKRLPVWEALHHLIRILKQGGESEGGIVLAAVADKAEAIRQLAYRLYTLCERKGWAEDARAYNELITSWTALESAAANAPKQRELFD